jgi:hypothetical protein
MITSWKLAFGVAVRNGLGFGLGVTKGLALEIGSAVANGKSTPHVTLIREEGVLVPFCGSLSIPKLHLVSYTSEDSLTYEPAGRGTLLLQGAARCQVLAPVASAQGG